MVQSFGGFYSIELSAGSRPDIRKLAYNKVNVPRGGEYQLTLSDGSKVQLNSMSSIRFPVQFAQDCRLVELEGDTYFEVSKTGQPFIVQNQRDENRSIRNYF